MSIFKFVKSAGEKLFKLNPAAQAAEVLTEQLRKFKLGNDGVKVDRDGDTVKVSGEVASQEEKEKILLALGNVHGVEAVDEAITVATAPAADGEAQPATAPADVEPVFYTVKKGDTLSAISKQVYGKASLYNKIFDANRPLLSHPDKIYPGQVLRIPPKD
ncbi:peptidoglycan-binding protein LysM [Xanthomonadaceae bacterium JHOS43]|nr:peptidoglycan-binding protein LysM [Xanthomonadaceae bacterium JHOS43]MCX7562446.1 peptidoglycan-binding protein LysM [Xanthomonadaceae bacterium XH05]